MSDEIRSEESRYDPVESEPSSGQVEAEPPPDPGPRLSVLDRFKRQAKKPDSGGAAGRVVPLPLAAGLLCVPLLGALGLTCMETSESGLTAELGGVLKPGAVEIVGFIGRMFEEEVEAPVGEPSPPSVPLYRPKVGEARTVPPPARAPDPAGVTTADTGAFWFICRQGHEDWEAIIGDCPRCGKTNHLYQDPGGAGIFCYSCKSKLSTSDIVCDRCGKPPEAGTRLKLKRR